MREFKNKHDVQVSERWAELNEEFAEQWKAEPIRWVVNTPEMREGKMEVLKKVVDVWNKKYLKELSKERKEDLGNE